MYTKKVNLTEYLKNFEAMPKGGAVHAVILEDEAVVAHLEGEGKPKMVLPKHFTQKVAGQTTTVATETGKFQFAEITKIGTSENVQRDYEVGDIIEFVPTIPSNLSQVGNTNEYRFSEFDILNSYKPIKS